jgi:predicted nucleotidyltransferase
MGLFGSYARDEAGPTSDIDLLVSFEEGRERFRPFMQRNPRFQTSGMMRIQHPVY